MSTTKAPRSSRLRFALRRQPGNPGAGKVAPQPIQVDAELQPGTEDLLPSDDDTSCTCLDYRKVRQIIITERTAEHVSCWRADRQGGPPPMQLPGVLGAARSPSWKFLTTAKWRFGLKTRAVVSQALSPWPPARDESIGVDVRLARRAVRPHGARHPPSLAATAGINDTRPAKSGNVSVRPRRRVRQKHFSRESSGVPLSAGTKRMAGDRLSHSSTAACRQSRQCLPCAPIPT